MFHVLEADTADALWQRAARWFLPEGIAAPQAGRGGTTAEVLRAALTLRDPRQRWIGSRSPAISPAFAIAEVVWIIAGRNDSALPNFFNRKLPQYAGHGDTYHGAYGFRMRRHFGLDQLERAYRVLNTRPESRQVLLQFWDPLVDLPMDDGSPRSEDIPCNIVSLLKVREQKLEWTQIMRSNDILRGLPHNIIQFSCLQEILAGWLGLEVGAYHHYSDSLHLYTSDGAVQEHIKPVDLPRNSDSLILDKGESERSFAELSRYCDCLTQESTSSDAILTGLEQLCLPEAQANFAAILASEALRRRGAWAEVEMTEEKCSNTLLRYLFSRWCERQTRERPF